VIIIITESDSLIYHLVWSLSFVFEDGIRAYSFVCSLEGKEGEGLGKKEWAIGL